jgi:cytochrome c peroxidase
LFIKELHRNYLYYVKIFFSFLAYFHNMNKIAAIRRRHHGRDKYNYARLPGKWSERIAALLLFAALCTACGINVEQQQKNNKNQPPLLPPAVQLGRYLFYDNNLSFNQTKSCASCHDPALAFTDGYRQSSTATGDNVLHNAPSLVNVVFQKRMDWANPAITNAYQQNERPLFNEHPVELGVKNNEILILARFQNNALYQPLLAAAFPNDTVISFMHIRKALAAFVNSLVSANASYDKYLAGDSLALSPAAKNGLALFFSQQLQCASCHPPPLFSVNDTRNKISPDSIYFNTGLYNTGKDGAYTNNDHGLFLATGLVKDKGKFKVPSLRNVALTAPYMHDGSVADLATVLAIYQRGGRLVSTGNAMGDGKLNPNKDRRITGFSVTEKQKKELLEFLYSLTDSSIRHNPSFVNPHRY